MNYTIIKTPIGNCKIMGNEFGISSLKITEDEPIGEISLELKECKTQLEEYFNHKRKVFTFKINLEGTDFQKKVWNELQNVSYGKTISYLELAKRIGNEKLTRAVANANAKNPLWIVVPCHRVIGTDGSLTGYAGGLWRKNWLLNFENNIQQPELF